MLPSARLSSKRQDGDRADRGSPDREATKICWPTVDSDVSRQVPSAMEPLAQLMDSDTNR